MPSLLVTGAGRGPGLEFVRRYAAIDALVGRFRMYDGTEIPW